MSRLIEYLGAAAGAIGIGLIAVAVGLGPEVYVPLQVVMILYCMEPSTL